MVVTSQRRTHSRWRMFFTFFIFFGLTSYCELASAGKLSDSGPSPLLSEPSLSESSSGRRRTEEIGSPIELAWKAWLLLDTQTVADLSGADPDIDFANLRRIFAKSIFYYQKVPTCPEDHHIDETNHCIKDQVDINAKNQLKFIVTVLNTRHRNQSGNAKTPGTSSSSNVPKQPSGPLKLSIPLSSNNTQSAKPDYEDSMEIPVIVPPQGGAHSNEKKEPQETILTVYEVKNVTTADEGKATLFLGNTTATVSDKDDRESAPKPDTVVPVAEFVDDANDTSFSEVVDYKIPIDLKTLLNVSAIKYINMSDDQEPPKNGSNTNSTDALPTLVFLLSPTKLPMTMPASDAGDSQADQNSTTSQSDVQSSSVTFNDTGKEDPSVSLTDSTLPPMKKFAKVPLIVVDNADGNETQNEDALKFQNSRGTDSQEAEPYDEDELEKDLYDAGIELPDEDSAEAEGEEILKHGEAGMTIPTKNIEMLHLEKYRQQMVQQSNGTKRNDSTKVDPLDDIVIRFNESATTGNDESDEAGTNVSSEVSINGDLILETTLLNLNTAKLKNVTKSSNTTDASQIEEDDGDLRVLGPDAEGSSEPEVVFSPQDVHGTVSTRLHGRKRAQQPKTEAQPVEDSKNEELEAAPSSSESLLYDPLSREQYTGEDSITELHAMDEKSSVNKEPASPEVSNVPDFRRISAPEGTVKNLVPSIPNFMPSQDYAQPVNYVRQPVRYHSKEINSIHNQDYKERLPYALDNGFHSSTKSSVPIHQKPSYWPWRTDRHQVGSQQVQATAANQRQKQRPMLLRFWTNMPLLRDPSLYPSGQGPQSETVGGQQQPDAGFLQDSPSRRINLYKELLPQDLPRMLRQKLKRPIGG